MLKIGEEKTEGARIANDALVRSVPEGLEGPNFMICVSRSYTRIKGFYSTAGYNY
jgi:hypothetical protein